MTNGNERQLRLNEINKKYKKESWFPNCEAAINLKGGKHRTVNWTMYRNLYCLIWACFKTSPTRKQILIISKGKRRLDALVCTEVLTNASFRSFAFARVQSHLKIIEISVDFFWLPVLCKRFVAGASAVDHLSRPPIQNTKIFPGKAL